MRAFRDADEVQLAYDSDEIGLQEPIVFRRRTGEKLVTTPGRVIFNEAIERELERIVRGDFDGRPTSGSTGRSPSVRSATSSRGLVDIYGAGRMAPVLDVSRSSASPTRPARA